MAEWTEVNDKEYKRDNERFDGREVTMKATKLDLLKRKIKHMRGRITDLEHDNEALLDELDLLRDALEESQEEQSMGNPGGTD